MGAARAQPFFMMYRSAQIQLKLYEIYCFTIRLYIRKNLLKEFFIN